MERLRVGTDTPVNESELYKFDALDIVFSQFYEFVYLPDYNPYELVNGTWMGSLGHLLKGRALNVDWNIVG